MTSHWRSGSSQTMLEQRAETLALIRGFFADRQVLEVQTATLATATVTDVEIESLQTIDGRYLQTSPEYQMKRLIAAGSGSIYQIGPAYRAEEQGRHHNQEFTLIEWYRVGWDDIQLRIDVRDLVNLVLGANEYSCVTYDQLVSGWQTDISESVAFDEGVRNLGKGRFFITEYPAKVAALARLCEHDKNVAARFELVVDGLELANGYFELGDAAQLEARFLQDNKTRKERGLKELTIDKNFLAAMASGLPKCAGVALGFDRLMMLRSGSDHINQVMPFL